MENWKCFKAKRKDCHFPPAFKLCAPVHILHVMLEKFVKVTYISGYLFGGGESCNFVRTCSANYECFLTSSHRCFGVIV